MTSTDVHTTWRKARSRWRGARRVEKARRRKKRKKVVVPIKNYSRGVRASPTKTSSPLCV